MLIGYARVSTQQQNLDLQIRALTETGCKKIFTEKVSGVERDRPELTAALKYMRDGDTLVVWKLDRLGRSMKQLINTIEQLKEQNIGFKSLTEFIDTTTPQGKLLFHISGAVAQCDRENNLERTMAGIKAARESGRIGGRPRALTDDDLIVAKTLLSNKEITVREVAKRLGIGRSTLYRYIPDGRSSSDLHD